MTKNNLIPHYEYAFNSGPLPEIELNDDIKEGNCRLLLQLFFYKKYGKYFSEEELLNPKAYLNTGEFIKKTVEDGPDYFSNLPDDCVIYAEKITDKNGNPADFSPTAFEYEDDYLVRLHSAIYVNDFENLQPLVSPEIPIRGATLGKMAILHATAVQGSTTIWSVEKFLQHYKPIAAKKFV